MKKITLVYGSFYSVISFIISIISDYWVSTILMIAQIILLFLLFIGVIALISKKYKNINSGISKFGELIKLYFVFIVFCSILTFVLTLIYNSVLPENTKLKILANDIIIEKKLENWIYEKLGNEEMILGNETISGDRGGSKRFSLKENLSDTFISFIVSFLFSMILALIFKKNSLRIHQSELS